MFQINSTWIHKNYKTMQGRKPKLTFPSAVELRFSNYSNIVLINSSLILDKKEKSIGSIF